MEILDYSDSFLDTLTDEDLTESILILNEKIQKLIAYVNKRNQLQ